jgi:hypothetical protein
MSAPAPPASGQFAGDRHAREHLCDHVLTRPEAHDWALILPGYLALVDPMNDDALLGLARSTLSPSPCARSLELQSAYLARLRLAIDDALRLGWWWEQRQGKYSEWFGLGLDGIHVIWNADVLKTGFFPASARFPPEAPPPRTENPLPRRSRLEKIRPPPPDSPRRRYELFRTCHYCVSNWYAEAYLKGKVHQAGGDVFVDPTRAPRIGKWQHWLTERPGESLPKGGPT